MTRITTAEAKRLGLYDRSVAAPEPRQPRQPRHQPKAHNSENAGITLQGVLGGHLHLWEWAPKIDGWLSRCGIQMSVGRPRPGEAVECARCHEE